MAHIPFTWLVKGLAISLAFGAASVSGVAAQDDGFDEPSMATTETLSALTVGTENPDDRVVPTHSLSSLEAQTHPLPAPTPTVDPSSLVVGTAQPGSLEAQTFSLGSLPSADAQERRARADAVREADLESPASPAPRSLAQAQSQLVRARAQLAAANTAVGTMMRRDYPTGEARLRLYDLQQNAKDAVFQAEGWVRDFGGTPDDSFLGDS